MKPICIDINRNLGKCMKMVNEKAYDKHSRKLFMIMKLRNAGKLGDERCHDYIHMAVMHFRHMDKRVS